MKLETVFKLGLVLGGISWLVLPKRRRNVLRNLRIAYCHEMDESQIKDLSIEAFQYTGANMLASMKTALMTIEQLREIVEIEGVEHFEKAQEKGTGVILFLSHMGNWEILAQLGAMLSPETKPGALYRPLNNPYMNELIKRRRSRKGTVVFAKGAALSAMTDHLKEGGMLGILADQRGGHHGVAVSFFERLTSVSPLPAVLHKRSKAAMVALSLETTEDGMWKIKFQPPIDAEGKGIRELSAEMGNAVEQSIRVSPRDYFWLQDRWKLDRWLPLGQYSKRGMFIAKDAVLQPFHVYLFLPADRSQLEAAMPAVAEMKHFRPDACVHCLVQAEHVEWLRRYDAELDIFPLSNRALQDRDELESFSQRHVEGVEVVLMFEPRADYARVLRDVLPDTKICGYDDPTMREFLSFPHPPKPEIAFGSEDYYIELCTRNGMRHQTKTN